MKGYRWLLGAYVTAALLGGGYAALELTDPEYAYSPPESKMINPLRKELSDTDQVKSFTASEELGDVGLGREAFAKETFGNEVFFSDIMGLYDGPFTIGAMAEAIVALRGQGTSNLKVRAARTAVIGDLTIREGDIIETGLDVPKGALMPLGVKLKYEDGKAKAGISCLVCHGTVDDATGKVVQGAPNTDLNIGLILAMGTNTAAYFTHSNIVSLQDYMKDLTHKVTGSDGGEKTLPDPEALEDVVDRDIMKWPRGSNDTTIDLNNDPVQIPDTFVRGEHPFGHSGQGVAGPYRGLTAAINNAHAQNMDAVSQSEISEPVMGIDKEVYLGTLLQKAANPKYRYDPGSGLKPSEFWAKVDPTPGVVGSNEMVPTPSHPRISFLSSVGLFQSSPGHKVWEQSNSMSAYMLSLVPPKPRTEASAAAKARGREVFEKAQCLRCHAGDYYTNNRILPVEAIGTEPSRAGGFKKTERFFEPNPKVYENETTVPLPESPGVKDVPLSQEQREQLKLAWAHGETKGGYKVPGLLALEWSPPYLHDGGVAVGPNPSTDLGVPGTLGRGIRPDPYNSLRALIDREERRKVMEANRSAGLASAHVTGEGHTYWADSAAGFTREDQDALIRYLLTLQGKPEER